MLAYQTPGVYYQRIDAAPQVNAVRSDVAGFVGIARRGLLDTPIPVESWRQYLAYFGDFTGAGYLAYAVRGFFENGGRRCWVVRIASFPGVPGGPVAACLNVQDRLGLSTWRLEAFSQGVWGNDLTISIHETHRAQALGLPATLRPDAVTAPSLNGFTRGTHLRLTQSGGWTAYRVVSYVDPNQRRLYWVHPDPVARLPYDRPLHGYDPNQEMLVESIEYNLLVREQGRLVREHSGLSLIPEHPSYGPRLVRPLEPPNFNGQPQAMPAAPEPVVIHELRDLETLALSDVQPLQSDLPEQTWLEGGADGLAALTPYDFIGEPYDPLDSDEMRLLKRRGLQTLAEVQEVSILAIPDIHIQPLPPPEHAPLPLCIPDPCLPPGPPLPAPARPPSVGDLPPIFDLSEIYQVQAAMVTQCEALRDRVALLDPPYRASRSDALGAGEIRAWRERFDTRYAALYYPWLKVLDPLRRAGALTRDIPPSGHIAGQYAHSDFQVGVHKAPANSPLIWAEDVTVLIEDALHGVLNPEGINAIRSFPGRGLRIFGARMLSSDPDWIYINVRRLLIVIAKSLFLATQWAVFEPNDFLTRAKLSLSIYTYLLTLWESGALMGAAPEQAFFVKCDDENNPPAEREQGRLICEVGIAPSIPFEFVVLRIGRTNNEFEIMESTQPIGGR